MWERLYINRSLVDLHLVKDGDDYKTTNLSCPMSFTLPQLTYFRAETEKYIKQCTEHFEYSLRTKVLS